MAGRTRSTATKDEGIFRKTFFMNRNVTFEESRACVVPVPYATTSYTEGTRDAPEQILLNWNVEDYDLELGYAPCSVGIYPLPEREYEGAEGLDLVRKVAKELFKFKKFPVFLGGDQAITIATAKAAADVFGDMTVIFLDAHSDMKAEFEGKNVTGMSVVKQLGDMDTLQIGVRNIGSEELDDMSEKEAFNRITDKELATALSNASRNVYISIDVDVFDPSLMPATPMPEPDGYTWSEVIGLIRKIAARKNIVGCDIAEHSPIPGFTAPSIMCAQLAYKVIGLKFEKEAKEKGWENGAEPKKRGKNGD
ncbi:N(1)-aminopropylagmatine ureohydrolase [uncultured archaeon]|nr:N(1)-aminopropylagmatine ureohydrolase [uncultured archaeon]